MKKYYLLLHFIFFAVSIHAQNVTEIFENTPVEKLPESKVLKNILKNNLIRVGVDVNYSPFSFMNIDGNLDGFEVDLAKETADYFGVAVEVVPVEQEEKFNFLLGSKVDLIIGRYQENDTRYGEPAWINPAFYSSGYVAFGNITSKVNSWRGLSKYKVCAVKNEFINVIAQQKYRLNLTTFDRIYEIKQNLKNNTACEVWLFDEAYIEQLLYDPEWKDFNVLLRSDDRFPWYFIINPNEADSDYANKLSDMIKDRFKKKFFSQLEWKWRIPYSSYVETMEKIFSGPEDSKANSELY